MTELETLIANLRYGAKSKTPATIGGGDFSPDEQGRLADDIERMQNTIKRSLSMLYEVEGELLSQNKRFDEGFFNG